MKNTKRDLPEHLTDNISSKCFVFRHPNLFRRKSIVFSYAHGRDYKTVRQNAVDYANRLNEALGPIPQLSPEGRMSTRNTSGIVRVHPRRTRAPRNDLFYYAWNTKWKGCPQTGGVSWPCLTHTDEGAYVLAALTLELRTVSRERVIEEFQQIKKTSKYREILALRPKIAIEDYWPDRKS